MDSSLVAPREVAVSVVGQCASFAVGLVTYAAMGALTHLVVFAVVWALIAVLLFFLFRALLRGKNWVRLLVLALVAGGLLTLPAHLSTLHAQWQRALYIGQGVVQGLSVALLFLPASNRWFSQKAKA